MKALYKASRAPGFVWAERPEPSAGTGEVKIRVLRTGICGTDLHIQSWDAWADAEVAAPLIPGHEFFGQVVAVGAEVDHIAVGDRVSGEGHIVCGVCRNCRAGRRQMCIRVRSVGVHRDGAFAEYVVIPATNVWVHPPDMDPDLGAIFDPFGNAVHTALSFPMVGEDVLVTGAGPIGLMAAAVAKHAGARFVVVTDVSPVRLALARRMGADLAVDVSSATVEQAQRDLGMREGFDIGLEMSGQPQALSQLIDNMNHGGRVAVLGLPAAPMAIDVAKVVTHMLTIRGIYGREMFETWYAMSALLTSGLDIAPVITDRFAAPDWAPAFAAARAGAAGKVVLDWSNV